MNKFKADYLGKAVSALNEGNLRAFHDYLRTLYGGSHEVADYLVQTILSHINGDTFQFETEQDISILLLEILGERAERETKKA